ncbi:MAG: hypothetical protein O2927_06195, partial [Planctomycetota bacterium]|nr:hypothetical protein [Planctomycetota bacterium]
MPEWIVASGPAAGHDLRDRLQGHLVAGDATTLLEDTELARLAAAVRRLRARFGSSVLLSIIKAPIVLPGRVVEAVAKLALHLFEIA